jgi:hypothetical protein
MVVLIENHWSSALGHWSLTADVPITTTTIQDTTMPSQTAFKSKWFDESTATPIIAEQSRRLDSFLAAVADGRVDNNEIADQEARLVSLMKEIEPQLDPALHDKVTQLLCELTAYDMMNVMNMMQQARPTTKFRG